jgi:hypothetical protein
LSDSFDPGKFLHNDSAFSSQRICQIFDGPVRPNVVEYLLHADNERLGEPIEKMAMHLPHFLVLYLPGLVRLFGLIDKPAIILRFDNS